MHKALHKEMHKTLHWAAEYPLTISYYTGFEVVNISLIVSGYPCTWSFMDACKALEALLGCCWLYSQVLWQKALLS